MAVKDWNSKIGKIGSYDSVGKILFGWSPRYGKQRQGKVVDVVNIGSIASSDTIDIKKLGLKSVDEVWKIAPFAVTSKGSVVTCLNGSTLDPDDTVRFIGR